MAACCSSAVGMACEVRGVVTLFKVSLRRQLFAQIFKLRKKVENKKLGVVVYTCCSSIWEGVGRDCHEFEASTELTVSSCQLWLYSKTLAHTNKDL